MASRDQAYQQWADLFESEAGYAPQASDIQDFENKWAKTSGEGGETRDWESLFAETASDLNTRFDRPTFSAGGIGGDDDPDGDGIAGGMPGGGGGNLDWDQLQQILDSIRSSNQDTVDLSNLQPGTLPSFEVPGENLSPAIDETLLNLMGGEDPLGMEGRLLALLNERTGGPNSERLQNRREAARENLVTGSRAALSDLTGRLAQQGLISMPGSPQGFEADMTARVLQPLQETYLRELRQSEFDESVRADDDELEALQMATGWTREQAATQLAAAGQGTARQQMLSQVALQQLDQNRQWNQFLAEFGLKREQLAAEIQQGRMDSVNGVLQMFLAWAGLTSRGYV